MLSVKSESYDFSCSAVMTPSSVACDGNGSDMTALDFFKLLEVFEWSPRL